MAKINVIRTNKMFTMTRMVERRKGRGAKFQRNSQTTYIISSTLLYNETYTYNNFKEADAAWVYLTLKHL